MNLPPRLSFCTFFFFVFPLSLAVLSVEPGVAYDSASQSLGSLEAHGKRLLISSPSNGATKPLAPARMDGWGEQGRPSSLGSPQMSPQPPQRIGQAWPGRRGALSVEQGKEGVMKLLVGCEMGL